MNDERRDIERVERLNVKLLIFTFGADLGNGDFNHGVIPLKTLATEGEGRANRSKEPEWSAR